MVTFNVADVPIGHPIAATATFSDAHHFVVCDTSVIAAFDCEYQRTVVAGVTANTLLSYQLGISHHDGFYTELIAICEDGERATLGEVCAAIFDALPKPTKRLMIVTHAGAAEWAALADRDDYVYAKHPLQAIRNAPVTFKPLQVRVPRPGRHYKTIAVCWRDTLLLAPQGRQKLEHLGEVCGVRKVELPRGAIERMRRLVGGRP